jgi:hypothetical protein
MIETQIAAAIPVNNTGKILGQPKNFPEFAHVATDQWGEVLPTDYKCWALAKGKSVVIFLKNSKIQNLKFCIKIILLEKKTK